MPLELFIFFILFRQGCSAWYNLFLHSDLKSAKSAKNSWNHFSIFWIFMLYLFEITLFLYLNVQFEELILQPPRDKFENVLFLDSRECIKKVVVIVGNLSYSNVGSFVKVLYIKWMEEQTISALKFVIIFRIYLRSRTILWFFAKIQHLIFNEFFFQFW